MFTARMVVLTCKHGISKYSCMAFASAALIFVGKRKKLAYDYGHLSLQLLQKFKAKEFIPSVNLVCYSNVFPRYTSMHDSCDAFLQSVCTSLEIGSQETSIVSSEVFLYGHSFVENL